MEQYRDRFRRKTSQTVAPEVPQQVFVSLDAPVATEQSHILSPDAPVDWTAVLGSPSQPRKQRISLAFLKKLVPATSIKRIPISKPIQAVLVGILLLATGTYAGVKSAVPAPVQTAQVLSSQTDPNAIQLHPTSDQQVSVQGTSQGLVNKKYSEKFEGVDTNVTLQVVPDNFRSDPDAMKKFATSMKAVPLVTSAKWGQVYVLSTGGVQVAAAANTTNLLIVQSFGSHTPDAWLSYLDKIHQ